MSLKQIIYASALSKDEDDSCLPRILATAVANNARQGVSGMLLYINRSFLQVLEGDEAILDPLYEKIRQDPRHTRPMTLQIAPIETRQFPDWSMGLAHVSADELDRIGRKNDFFKQGHCLTELDESLARKILGEFRSGLWRTHVT